MSQHDRYRVPSDLPARLPVFPLRGAILLPRATLPLNIFEPRYLKMIDDSLAGERLIGIVQPAGGDPDLESPPGQTVDLKRTGCAGRITGFQELDDGRLVITLTGICRFDIVSEAEVSEPYRVVSASFDRFASDFDASLGEEQVDRGQLLRVLRNYLKENNITMDWAAIERASSEFLVNALSIMSPYGPEEKQALLEAPNLKSRAEILIALAEMDIASSGTGSGGTLQ